MMTSENWRGGFRTKNGLLALAAMAALSLAGAVAPLRAESESDVESTTGGMNMTMPRDNAPTPIEAAGYEPIWQENITDGTLDCMRLSPAFGMLEDYDTFCLPGAFHWGQKNASSITEQQLNYYRDPDDDQPLAQTLEYVFAKTVDAKQNPEIAGNSHRIFYRIRGFRDGGRITLGPPEKGVDIRHPKTYKPGEAPELKRGERYERVHEMLDMEVHAGDWVHFVYTYHRDPETRHFVTTVAVNGELVSYEGPSQDHSRINREKWSLEWASTVMPDDGWYIRDIRGYKEYIAPDELEKILDAGLAAHLKDQPSVSDLEAMYDQRNVVMANDPDVLNVMEPPADGIPGDAVTLGFEDLVFKVPTNQLYKPKENRDPVYVTRNPDPSQQRVYVQFEPMRIVKLEYDTRGEGKSEDDIRTPEGAFQSAFRIGAGLTGWNDNRAWHTIAKQSDLDEGRVFTFYPNIQARGLMLDNATVKKDGEPADFWFWNLKNLKITGIPLD